jgi:hypothetical protein
VVASGAVLSQAESTLVPETGASCAKALVSMKTEIARAEKIAAINRVGRTELIDRHYHRI